MRKVLALNKTGSWERDPGYQIETVQIETVQIETVQIESPQIGSPRSQTGPVTGSGRLVLSDPGCRRDPDPGFPMEFY